MIEKNRARERERERERGVRERESGREIEVVAEGAICTRVDGEETLEGRLG